MELVHEETDKQGITYRLYIEEDDLQVRGNAMASGDAKVDKRVEDRILRRLDKGDTWAWASVDCEASFNGFEGHDYLGACSYRNTKDFITGNGYWKDMKAEAKDHLLSNLALAKTALESLATKEN